MLKIIMLLLGLAVGFGAGVWWGVHNPDRAKDLAAEEERRFLEYKLKVTEALRDKLDNAIDRQREEAQSRPTGGKTTGPSAGGRSSFADGSTKSTTKSARGSAQGEVDPELKEMLDEEERQLEQLRKRLDELSE